MKPSQSTSELLTQLLDRGLLLTDTVNTDRALRYLRLDGYYRLSGYFWFFYDETKLPEHQFKKDTTWDDVLHIYHADKDLRYLLTQALAEIEISMKAILVDTVCERLKKGFQETDDPSWCWNPTYYQRSFQDSKDSKDSGFTKLRQKLERNRDNKHSELFLKKFVENNPNQNPYTWMMMQTLTFGEVANIVNNLDLHLIEGFSEIFTLGMVEMTSVLNSLNKLRNACAHHNRVWNTTIRDCPTPKVAVCLRPTQHWVVADLC
ncbi:MAG: Abi family protein [Vampirovibrio sp.]|nr:Abi family protein [Vampirovibrio sp.]